MPNYIYPASLLIFCCINLGLVCSQANNRGWGDASSNGNPWAGSHVGHGIGGSNSDQYGYDRAGIDGNGRYGVSGGNDGYYLTNTDDRGRVFSYGSGANGQAGQPGILPGQPGYSGRYYQDGYRSYRSGGQIPTSACGFLLLAVLAASHRVLFLIPK